MASIIIPRKWNSQPQGPIELNDAHWLVQKGIALYMPLGAHPGVVLGTVQLPSTDGVSRIPDPSVPGGGLVASISSNYIEFPFAVCPAFPFTYLTWVNTTTVAADQTVLSQGTAGGTARTDLWLANASDKVSASGITSAGGASTAVSVAAYTANAWHHAAAKFNSIASRFAGINGVFGTEQTTSRDSGTPNRTTIASRMVSGAYGGYFQGSLAHALILPWALSSDEYARLYYEQRVNPYEIVKPWVRRSYFDVGGSTTDTPSAAGSSSFAITGSAANGVRAKVSAAGSSSYVITGVAASGVKESTGDTPSAANSGSYVITGVNASAVRALKASAESSSYAITGSDASGLISIGANAEVGSFSISGSDADGKWVHVSNASEGAFLITGYDAIGEKSGAITLTPEDLDAIAAAVWASSEAVAAHAKLDAILARITC